VYWQNYSQLFLLLKCVRELPAVGCTLWQSIGMSVCLWGFANVCNVGGVSFFAGGKKKTK